MNRLLIPFLFLIFICYSCKKETTELSTSVPKFAFYKLADSTISATKAWTLPIDSLNLALYPFLTENDLTAYYWSMHSFTAHSNIASMCSQLCLLLGKSSGVPFVVVANGSRIYIAAFWWSYSSSMPMGAYIDACSASPYIINREQSASLPDLRGDERIHNALKSAGILVE